MINEQLKGLGVAMVTPFKASGDLDFEALERIIQHLIEGGVDYIVSLGTTGETPTISAEEKNELIQHTYRIVAGRVPVVVGIGGYDTRDIIKRLETCPLEEAAAVLSVSPYYSRPSQQGLIEHYKLVSKASPKPVMIYNVPARTGRNITAATTLQLAKECDNIFGIKEASGDMQQCMQILKSKPESFLVVSGDDNLALSQIAIGMQGLISVAGNFYIRQMAAMVHDALNGQLESARASLYELLDAFDLMFAENNPAGIKAFMALSGLCENHLRLPLVPVSEALMNLIRSYVKSPKGS